jgi:hypothetical protein
MNMHASPIAAMPANAALGGHYYHSLTIFNGGG